MIQPHLPSRPFVALDNGKFQIAQRELETKFKKKDVPDNLKTVHKKITLKWHQALADGHKPTFLARIGRNPEVVLLRLGERCFPLVLHGPSQLDVLPPVDLEDLDKDAVKQDGLAGLYGGKKELDQQPWARLVRNYGESTNIRVGDFTLVDDAYAWALWTVIAQSVKLAGIERGKKDAMAGSTDVPRSGAAAGSTEAILEGDRGVRQEGALPAGIVHELSGLEAWRGQLIALTGRQDGSAMAVRIEQRDRDGQTRWREIPWPAGERLPVRGARLALRDDTLYVVGGVDKDGALIDNLFAYSLNQGARDDFSAAPWRPMGYGRGIAWPALAVVDGDLVICGGAGAVAKVDGNKPAMPVAVKRLVAIGARFLEKREPPAEMVGSNATGGRGCVVVGPGAARDGRVHLFDLGGNEWYALPPLPRPLGLGQVSLAGDTVLYTGGFDADGEPSATVYALDLDELQPRWREVGESVATMGLSRWVRRGDRVTALGVTPEMSVRFDLG